MTGVDDLYAGRSEDFVAARAALVKELRATGRKDEAVAAAKLRRPTAVAWALNQVARREPALVEAAVEAGQQLRAASDDAVAGRPEQLRAATAAERAAASAVAKAAGELLGARAGSLQIAVLATIRVAALDPAVADELRRGVLTTEHEQPGFGFGLGGDDGPVVDRPKPAPKAKRPKLTAVPDLEPDDADDEAARAAAEAERAARAERRVAERALRKEQAERKRTYERRAKEAARLAREAEDAEAAARTARAAADEAQARAVAAEEALNSSESTSRR